MNEHTCARAPASHEQQFDVADGQARRPDWRHWVAAALIVACYAYFDVGTRWKLAGSWDCEQENNGYRTIETFGFFGHRATNNQGGSHDGVSIIGSFDLSGKLLSTRPDYAERNGERLVDAKSEGSGVLFKETIQKLDGDELVYELNTDPRTAVFSCRRR